jgi:hypothetical protein
MLSIRFYPFYIKNNFKMHVNHLQKGLRTFKI